MIIVTRVDRCVKANSSGQSIETYYVHMQARVQRTIAVTTHHEDSSVQTVVFTVVFTLQAKLHRS